MLQCSWQSWWLSRDVQCMARGPCHSFEFKDDMHACMQAIAAVQEKLLRLSSATFCHVSTGKIINMVSNDVRRFEEIGLYWPYMWAAPLEAVAVVVLIALQVGWVPAIAGVCPFTMCPFAI